MFGTQNLLMFLTAGILLNLTPGPDTVYILGRSIAQGRKGGIFSALGHWFGLLSAYAGGYLRTFGDPGHFGTRV